MSEHDHQAVQDGDRGSAMIMVLAFTIIAALIVIPMLTYAMTVLRVNTVSVDKREELEAVRGGARVAIADTRGLFLNCVSQSTFVTLPTPAVDSVSQCRQISEVGVTDQSTIPYSAVALQPGEQILSQPFSGVSHIEPPAGASHDWWLSEPYDSEPTAGNIWLPHLPVTDSTIQSPTGHALPAPYDCQVFFPGTYDQPIYLAGPTYFASGNYYFEESVHVLGGAVAVAGFGVAQGCASDLQAFSDIDVADAPQRFNIDGNGATFILGEDARLIVDDSKTLDGAGTVVDNTANERALFRMNTRYVQFETDAGARVSVMTVNGDTEPVDPLDPTGPTTVQDLLVTDLAYVPESQVVIPQGDTSTTVPASDRGYEPSEHTAEPTVPKPPVIVSVQGLEEPSPHNTHRHAAAHVTWAAPGPGDEGGSTITKYEVFDQNGNLRCETDGALECIIDDLQQVQNNPTYDFTVVATNDSGASDPSDAVTEQINPGDPRIIAPLAPANVAVDQVDGSTTTTPESAWITWDAPIPSANGSQFDPFIQGYEVRAYRRHVGPIAGNLYYEDTGQTCETERFRNDQAPTECIIEGLPPLDTTPGAGPEITPAAGPIPAIHGTWEGYVFRVTAITVVPEQNEGPTPLVSPESDDSNVINVFDGAGTATPLAPPVMPVAAPNIPDPVVDIQLTNASNSRVNIPGYVAIPQGRLRISNPADGRVRLKGGVIAGTYDIDSSNFGTRTTVGFENIVLQRTLQVITTLPGSNRSSTMTLQINANTTDVAVNSWVTQ